MTIYGFHHWTVLYPKPNYDEPCFKKIAVYIFFLFKGIKIQKKMLNKIKD